MIYKIVNERVRQNLINEIKSRPLGYQVKIEDIKRSNNANALYWKQITVIADHFGSSPIETIQDILGCSFSEANKIKNMCKDDWHDAFKRQFIGKEQGVDMFGNLYIRPKSSAKLKKKEFSEYMNKVQIFAMQNNITLPQPDYYGLEA